MKKILSITSKLGISFYALLCAVSCKTKNTGNIAIGMSHQTDTIKIEVCKHGADWNHPGCDEK